MKECLTRSPEFRDHVVYRPFDGHVRRSGLETDRPFRARIDDNHCIEAKLGLRVARACSLATSIQIDKMVSIMVLDSLLFVRSNRVGAISTTRASRICNGDERIPGAKTPCRIFN
jgi:hypothetical protein